MPFFPGSRPEQIPTWAQIHALFNLRRLRELLLPIYTIAALRQTRFLRSQAVLVIDLAAFGIFRRDDADTTTADDGVDTILTADDVPVRFKRRVILRRYTPTSGTDTSMETGSVVYDANHLHVKTGASTIEKVPLKMTIQGNVVANTVVGGASDTNYWAKIGNISGTANFTDVAMVLGYSVANVSLATSGTIRILCRRSTGAFDYVAVTGGEHRRILNTVKLVRVSDSAFDIWVQKNAAYSMFQFTLLGMSQTIGAVVSFYMNAPWVVDTGAEPSVLSYPESGTGSCTTATRPITTYLPTGYNIWDSTISKQIFWNGSSWRDAQGAAV